MTFGINAQNVYANDGVGNPAFWTVFPGGTHGKITAALTADATVQAAIQANLSDPNNAAKRAFVIDHIDRATNNCIGQQIVGQALQPEEAPFSLYNLLAAGTAAAIDGVIGAPANTALHNALAAKSVSQIIDIISRQTGRALFQTCVSQLIAAGENPGDLLGKLETALKSAALGVVGDLTG